MKRASLLLTFLLVAVSHAVVRADVTITTTNSIDGPMAGLVGANGSSMTMRVQGLKARSDMEIMGRTLATVMDVAGKQIFMLDQTEKTVRRMPLASLFNGQNAAIPVAQPAAGPEGLPCLSEIEMNYEGTGPMIDMLRKMGAMKVTSRLTAISVAPIDPELFAVPAGYTEASAQDPLIPRH
jgi:hypothetical protein